jgi:hypothetical protein
MYKIFDYTYDIGYPYFLLQNNTYTCIDMRDIYIYIYDKTFIGIIPKT